MMRRLSKLAMLSALLLEGCSGMLPARWRDFPYPKEHLTGVEKTTDAHGLYLEYSGLSRDELFRDVESALVRGGYSKTGVALDGAVLGFQKGDDQVAVKVDQFGDELFVAIFDEQGADPLLHGLVFGKYRSGETLSAEEARERLEKELEKP